jgi:hypothetical protein
MAWKAYTDTQALKELAGLRGVAPSVRFLEKRPQSSTKEKIYHVKTNTPIYLWGVEMFQGGYDCVTINRINSDGTLTLYKDSGGSIENFINQDKKVYNFNLTEYPSFDDFWSDPYLVNYIAGGDTTNTSDDEIKKIVKSNFHRCFVFPNEGYYKITLDERLNPLTGSTGFVANYSESQYAPVTDVVSKSYFPWVYSDDLSTANKFVVTSKFSNLSSQEKTIGHFSPPIQAVRTEYEFKREIIIRVIDETKDIVDGTTSISRRVIALNPGLSDKLKYNLTPVSEGSGTKLGSFHIKGNNTFIGGKELFNNDNRTQYTNGAGINTIRLIYPLPFLTVGFDIGHTNQGIPIIKNTDLEDLYFDNDMEFAPIQKELYVGSQVNNGTLSGTSTVNGVTNPYNPSNNNNDSGLRKLKIINARNSIIENLNFFGADGNLTASEPRFRGPNPWWIATHNLTEYNDRYQVKYAALDFSGSIIRNCVFEGDSFTTMSFRSDQYGIYTRYIFDGCTFENCTFRRCNFLGSCNGTGILIKNCKFEKAQKNGSISDSTFGVFQADSMCIMGCNFEDLGRTFWIEPYGPISNNIYIRCTDSRKSSQHTAGEGATIDAPNEGGFQWAGANGFNNTDRVDKHLVTGNIFIFNESSYSSGANLLLSSYNAIAKLNLSAFTTHFNDPGCYLKPPPSSNGNSYNVYMHNYSYGTVLKITDLENTSIHNRFLNCVYQGAPGGANSFGSFMHVANTIYGNPPLFKVTSNAKSNLVNNCSIVDYLDKIQYPRPSWYPLNDSGNSGIYGDQTPTNNGFIYANSTTGEMHKNLSDSQIQQKLDNNENIINNLTKIGLRHI